MARPRFRRGRSHGEVRLAAVGAADQRWPPVCRLEERFQALPHEKERSVDTAGLSSAGFQRRMRRGSSHGTGQLNGTPHIALLDHARSTEPLDLAARTTERLQQDDGSVEPTREERRGG